MQFPVIRLVDERICSSEGKILALFRSTQTLSGGCALPFEAQLRPVVRDGAIKNVLQANNIKAPPHHERIGFNLSDSCSFKWFAPDIHFIPQDSCYYGVQRFTGYN